MRPAARIFVAGHRGLAGSAILRKLVSFGYYNLITRPRDELDLLDQAAVRRFFDEERPEYVFLAAAKVGGILANKTYPADFISSNLTIQMNIIQAAWRTGVRRLMFLGSSCIYPRDCPQPMKEEYLLSGPLESTNRAYAVAKIAGIEMCKAHNQQYGTRFVAVMPTNLYGPGDHYDLQNSHVLPALIRRFHEAKVSGASEVTLWGSGTPRREFLHSDDLAAACVFLMGLPDHEFSRLSVVNIGCGSDLTIMELAELVRAIVGYEGEVSWDASKPDGTPRKLLDVSQLSEMGWKAAIPLKEGLKAVYEVDFMERFGTCSQFHNHRHTAQRT